MPYLGIFGLDFKKLLSCLISAPSNLSNCKILQKNKNPEIWDQNTLFGYFWAIILKNYCHICNQHPQICQK